MIMFSKINSWKLEAHNMEGEYEDWFALHDHKTIGKAFTHCRKMQTWYIDTALFEVYTKFWILRIF